MLRHARPARFEYTNEYEKTAVKPLFEDLLEESRMCSFERYCHTFVLTCAAAGYQLSHSASFISKLSQSAEGILRVLTLGRSYLFLFSPISHAHDEVCLAVSFLSPLIAPSAVFA